MMVDASFLAENYRCGLLLTKYYIPIFLYDEHLHQNILIGISFLIRLRNLIIKNKMSIYYYYFCVRGKDF